MAKSNVFGFTGKKIAKMIKAAAMVDPERALMALRQYGFFVEIGGKRPNLHDEHGRIICPVFKAIVPELERVAGITLDQVAPIPSHREKLRMRRRRQHWLRTYKLTLVPTPMTETVEIVDQEKVENETEQHSTDLYNETAVLSRSFKGRTTVVAFFDGRDTGSGWDKPNRRTIFHIADSGEVTEATNKSGGAKSMPLEQLVSWKWGELKDFPALLAHMAERMQRAA